MKECMNHGSSEFNSGIAGVENGMHVYMISRVRERGGVHVL